MEKTIIRVQGMMYNQCETLVTQAVLKVQGVAAAEAHLERGTVEIQHESDVERNALVAAIQAKGFDAVSE
ncbi:copper-binding protein [Bacillaceae bacterium SIJ1]|uniref:heavy-metal-associated domain-containing protein n=1 Tax=Litoribacterium kuwaitense TaxID=1398745 RepID=UPI0013EC24A8|nr:heavy metal-associated domain-containing protein [Litoribacterium kuwaitense]NGP46298.1 copper-binding protein [Litoribacterium kuwaitense]